jgi:deoxycytidylate deaminase
VINQTIQLARENTTEYNHKVACIITDKRGNVISQGMNSNKSHPIQAKFAKLVGKEEKIYLHAEISALVKCHKEPHTIYVARITQAGNMGIAKPCLICQEAIRQAGVKFVVYTDDNDTVTRHEV